MIAQAELQNYTKMKKAAEALEAEYKSVKEALTKRLLAKEEVESGELFTGLKSFDKTTTKYAEVVKGLTNALEAHPELMEQLSQLLSQYSETKHYDLLDVFTGTEEVVIKVRRKKVA